MKNQQSGAILPLVCLLFLALSFIFSALLHSIGNMIPRVNDFEKRLQEQYDAESAILLSVYHEPFSRMEKTYPRVDSDTLGPWLVLKTEAGKRHVKAMAGFYSFTMNPAFSKLALEQSRARVLLFYQDRWRKESYDDTLYGSTHFYKPDSKDFLGVNYVAAGDLTLYLQGERFSKVAFYVEGDVKIEGEGIIDSLRLFTTGCIILSGRIKIYDASLYAREKIQLSDQIEARGVFLSEDTVVVPLTKRIGFPFWTNVSLENENQDSVFFPVDLAYQKPLRIFSWSIE